MAPESAEAIRHAVQVVQFRLLGLLHIEGVALHKISLLLPTDRGLLQEASSSSHRSLSHLMSSASKSQVVCVLADRRHLLRPRLGAGSARASAGRRGQRCQASAHPRWDPSLGLLLVSASLVSAALEPYCDQGIYRCSLRFRTCWSGLLSLICPIML